MSVLISSPRRTERAVQRRRRVRVGPGVRDAAPTAVASGENLDMIFDKLELAHATGYNRRIPAILRYLES